MKTLIAVPCMDMVYTSFTKALLSLERVGDTRVSFVCSSLIYDARNSLAKQAVMEGYDRVLWLDSDMVFEPNLLARLTKHIDEGKEFVSGIFFKRKPPFTPVIYSKVAVERDEEKGITISIADPYLDYPKDSVFEVAGCGLGAVMMTTDLINRVAQTFGLPFSPILGLGEDLSFSLKVKNIGAQIWCDSRIKVGHTGFGNITEETYLSTQR